MIIINGVIPNRKAKLSLRLNNTGLRRLNHTTVEVEYQFSKEQEKSMCKSYMFGGYKQVYMTYVTRLIQSFKEDLSQHINEQLLDECKGHNWSIPRHGAFETWLESAQVKVELDDFNYKR